MIISEEGRYRASLAAGLKEAPCIEKDVDEAEGLKSLADRFDYTHEQIAGKISKARSSVTETLSINDIPEDIREMRRQTGVMSKSMLLQIVRQPSRRKMTETVRRFAQREISREDARKERVKGNNQRPQPYVFRLRPPTRKFNLDLRFAKSEVGKEELIQVLQPILKALQEEQEKTES